MAVPPQWVGVNVMTIMSFSIISFLKLELKQPNQDTFSHELFPLSQGIERNCSTIVW